MSSENLIPTTGMNRLKQCRHGLMLYNTFDNYVGRSLEMYGEFAEGETDLFKQVIRPGDVVIDVGAHVGPHTVFFAKQVGPQGAVLAFEPQRILFQTLCANAALNSLTNVYAWNLACGEKDGTIVVPNINYEAENNFGGLALGQYQGGQAVDMVRLDKFQVPRCRLIKVDVEGMELDVLKGAIGIINQFKPALYVENDRDQRSDELIRFIDSLGYNLYWDIVPTFRADNFFNNSENAFANIASFNMICLPKTAPADLKGLEQIQVPVGM